MTGEYHENDRIGMRSIVALALAAMCVVSCSSEQAPRAWFTDVSEASGIDFHHENGVTGKHRYPETIGAGVGLFDYDGDGWLDIYLTNGNYLDKAPSPSITNVLYRNNRDGTFTDVTKAAGVGDAGHGQGCCTADFDNDGDQDLYLTNYGRNRLFKNNGDGTFDEVGRQAGVDCELFGQHCEFFDFDHDGWLDLYVQNYVTYDPAKDRVYTDYSTPRAFLGQPDRLYRNNGDGTFTDMTVKSGMHKPYGRGMGAAAVDFDEDQDIDLFVANDGMENYFFTNNGDGTFTETSVRSGLAFDRDGNPESSMGVDVGDLNGDGRIDIVCPALAQEGCTYYENRGNAFEDASRKARILGSTRPYTGFSPNLADFDNDGDLDLFVCNGGVATNPGRSKTDPYERRFGVRDVLLVNDGTGKFDLDTERGGPYFERELIGRGSAAGDLDNDGDIDLVIGNLRGKTVVLRNDAPKRNWITLVLRATKTHRDPVGARITMTLGGKTHVAVVRGGGGYLSQNDRRVHFGLGDAARIERIVVVWPDGARQTLRDVAANQFLEITQD